MAVRDAPVVELIAALWGGGPSRRNIPSAAEG